MKKIIITGGCGFLGCHLARFLIRKKYQVTLLDLAPLEAADLTKKVTVISADVRDKAAVEAAIKGQNFVIHAAAALPIQKTKQRIFSTNIEGTKNVLAASLKHQITRLIFISSTAVYGVPKHLPETEDAPLDPIGYYGQSKVEGEKLCREYLKKGLSINIVRPKSFLGPERLGVFELWFEAIHNHHRVFILGNGHNLYQLLDVGDLAEAIYKLLTTKISGEIFNLGAEKFGTWRQDLGYVIKTAGSKSKITSLPSLPSQIILMLLEKLDLSPLSAWHYKTMPVDSYVSIDKAKMLLNWQPKVSNQKLFLDSYKWYQKHRSQVSNKAGLTHRVGWNFKILNLLSRI